MQMDVEELYQIGKEKYLKDDFTDALKILNKVIKNEPKFASAYCMRGLTKLKLKKIRSAFLDLNKAIELEPKNTFILANRGLTYYKTRKYLQAFEELNKVLELDPEYESAFSLRIVIKAKLGYFKSAINDYNLLVTKKPKIKSELPYILSNIEPIIKDVNTRFDDSYSAIDGNPDSFKTYYVIGVLHYLDKEYEDAEQNFSKAININPNIPELYSLRGSVRTKIERKFYCYEVFNDYKMAYELDPNYEYLFELAKQETLHYNQGDKEEEKLKYVNKFIDEEPYEEEAGEAYYYRANAYFGAEQYEKAAKDYTQAIKNDYDYPDTYLKRGECYFYLNYKKRTLKDLDYALTLKLDEEEWERAYYLRAGIKEHGFNDYEGALEDYNEIFNNGGCDWYESALSCRADVLYKLERYDESIAAYTYLIKLGVDYVYEDRGKVYLKKRDYKKAIRDFNKILKKNKSYGDSDVYYYRGCAKREIGDFEGAEKDFKEYETRRYDIKEPFIENKTIEYYKRNYHKNLIEIEAKLNSSPNDVDLYYKRVIIFISCEKYKEALKDLNKIINIRPEYEKAYFERARIKGILGDTKGKYSDLRKSFLLQIEKCKQHNKKNISLFLYRPLNKNTFSSLTNNYLWFSHPADFNDPLDSRFYENATKDEDLLRVLKEVRIRSFAQTDVNKNTLLWAHYADRHTGIAIEYEIDTETLKENNIILCNMDYSSTLTTGLNPQLSDYGRSFFTKSEDWSYENEWRMVTLATNLIDEHKLKTCFKIKSIIFGLMTNAEDIEAIKNILGNNCKYYKMRHVDKLYAPFKIRKEKI